MLMSKDTSGVDVPREEPAMLVREVMTPEPVTVHPDTATKVALRMLDERAITSMPVVQDGRIVGVVSEADLVRDAVPRDGRTHLLPTEDEASRQVSASCVLDVMNRHPLTVEANLDLADAVDLMTSTAVKSVPVVDRAERVVGMLSRRDVVHLLARGDDLISQELDALNVSLGVDWLVDVCDGVVTVEGPVGDKDRALATTAAATIPGVRSVTVLE
jgi:CBS domain-containing protein